MEGRRGDQLDSTRRNSRHISCWQRQLKDEALGRVGFWPGTWIASACLVSWTFHVVGCVSLGLKQSVANDAVWLLAFLCSNCTRRTFTVLGNWLKFFLICKKMTCMSTAVQRKNSSVSPLWLLAALHWAALGVMQSSLRLPRAYRGEGVCNIVTLITVPFLEFFPLEMKGCSAVCGSRSVCGVPSSASRAGCAVLWMVYLLSGVSVRHSKFM